MALDYAAGEFTPTTKEMIEYVIRRKTKESSLVFTEFQPIEPGYRKTLNSVRFDILEIREWGKEIRIWEVKLRRSNFKDDNKWQKYLPYCTHFSFVAPKDVIRPLELPRGVGLLELVGSGYIPRHTNGREGERLKEIIDKQYYDSLVSGIIYRIVQQQKAKVAKIIKEMEIEFIESCLVKNRPGATPK